MKLVVLLMVHKSHSQPPGMFINTPENNGINYQPQLVSRISAINSRNNSQGCCGLVGRHDHLEYREL